MESIYRDEPAVALIKVKTGELHHDRQADGLVRVFQIMDMENFSSADYENAFALT